MSNKNPDNENEKSAAASELDDFLNFKETTPTLSDKQLDALEHYLDSRAAQNAMHMEVLDGFLCALITGPVPVRPEEYLPYIFGGKMPEFSSQEQSDEIMGALAQHWSYIESVLKRGNEYYPFLYADPSGNAVRTSGLTVSYWVWICVVTAGKKWSNPAKKKTAF